MSALKLSELTNPIWKMQAGPRRIRGIAQAPNLAVNNDAKQPATPSIFDKVPGTKWLGEQVDNARVYEIPKTLIAKSVDLPMFPFVDAKADMESSTGAVRERTIRLEVDAKTWEKLSVLPLVARRARFLAEDNERGNVLSLSHAFFKAHNDYDSPISAQSLTITMENAGEYVRGNQLVGGVDGLKAKIDIHPVLNTHAYGRRQRMEWADQILPNEMARPLFTSREEQESIRREESYRAVMRGPQLG